MSEPAHGSSDGKIGKAVAVVLLLILVVYSGAINAVLGYIGTLFVIIKTNLQAILAIVIIVAIFGMSKGGGGGKH